MKRKNFKYRIYPSKSQTTKLNQTLGGCSKVYNIFLEERKTEYEQNKKTVSCYAQKDRLPELKAKFPYLKNIHSQVLQNVPERLELAFQAFFRRVKNKEKPGYPRFQSHQRYDSFTFPQTGFKIIPEKSVIQLSKIGRIKIKYHRPIIGQIKTCNVKRTRTGKWFVTLSVIFETVILKKTGKNTGIDVGLESFATFANGKTIENPRFFRKEEGELAKAQRKLSKQKKGSPERIKARKVVSRIHERIGWKRNNFAHQESRKIVNIFDLIAVEDLNINNMQKDNYRCLNKSIGDAAWRKFIDFIFYKAGYAGKKCIKVNPAYTSQTCSKCGYRAKKALSERQHRCSCCGFSIHRDHNAAINILRLGQQSQALCQEAQ